MPSSYVALLCGCLLAGGALAQGAPGADFGLPLNAKEGAWARYALDENGSTRTLVIRCGGPGKHKGRSGRWYVVEVELPDGHRVAVRTLVAGKVATPGNVLKTEVVDPAGKVATVEPDPAEVRAPLPAPRPLPGAELALGGRHLAYSQFLFPDGTRVGWSAAVPGLGFVYVTGETRYALVAMGTGGDAWKGAERTAFWPEGIPPPLP